jgi:hypothetical protein
MNIAKTKLNNNEAWKTANRGTHLAGHDLLE